MPWRKLLLLTGGGLLLGWGLADRPARGIAENEVRARIASALTDVANDAPLRKRPADRIADDIRYLASPQLAGRWRLADKQKAAEYLVARYRALGLAPLFAGEYLQPVPGPRGPDGAKETIGHNVGALLPGTDPKLREEILIVSAHYDHIAPRGNTVFPGADDNASGVAMVLETARSFSNRPARRSIAFINFDLEESLLWGSKWFAAHPPWPLERVKFMLTADMLGRSLGDLPLPAVFVMGAERSREVALAVQSADVPAGLELARLGADYVGTRSDYGPFRDAGIPFLFFSTGEHPDYHRPGDTADKVDAAKVARVTDVVGQIVRRLADADAAPSWQAQAPPDVEDARTMHRITALLMDQERQRGFNASQRLLISHVHARTEQILSRGAMSESDRLWLIRSAQLMLFSVF